MPSISGLLVAVLICIAISGCELTPVPSVHNDTEGRPLPASVANDVELLVDRCGTSNVVLDRSVDNPRPPIPTRILTYRKAHLKVAYFPDAPMGSPPPYHWKLMGLIDTRTNEAVSARDLKITLQRQLPCMLANPNESQD